MRASSGISSIGPAVLTFVQLLAASVPMYLLAVWSYAAAFWATATPDVKGWMIVLFPVLAIPPIIPWLVVAAPIALAFSIRIMAIRCALIAGAVIALSSVEARFFVPQRDSGGTLVSDIGTLSFDMFVGGVWALTVGAFLLLGRTSANGRVSREPPSPPHRAGR